MYQIGVFATGRGQGSRGLLQALHNNIESGHLPVEVAFVFSNREPGEFEATDGFFELVQEYGYPLVTSSFRKFRAALEDDPDWRRKYEADALQRLERFRPEICLLAGFLLWVPEMCRRYTMINLHPAAPGGPVGMWQEVIWQLIESRAAATGNNMLSVIEDLDKGPTVTFSTFPITGHQFDRHWKATEGRAISDLKANEGEKLHLFRLIREEGVARERPLVVETVKAFAEGRVRIQDGLVVDGNGNPAAGLDLTEQIEAAIAGGGMQK